jgi:hypothetical protein
MLPFTRRARLPALLLALCAMAPVQAQTTAERPAGHLRLVDKLDRPEDGYCLDIMGSGEHIRPDLPMTVHNCKPGLYADEAVRLEPDGRLYFPVYRLCATVAGLNGRALAGAALVPRACGERSPFMEADALQRFTHRPDGRVELRGSGLCLTAGSESDRTFEATHRWRTLNVVRCNHADPKLSRWQFVVPKS